MFLDEMSRYWDVNKQITAHALKKPWRSVAVRVVRGSAKALHQEPLSPIGKEGQELTLAEALLKLAPDVIDAQTLAVRQGVRVLVQGITPALDASVVWLAAHLSSADNFLYLVLAIDE